MRHDVSKFNKLYENVISNNIDKEKEVKTKKYKKKINEKYDALSFIDDYILGEYDNEIDYEMYPTVNEEIAKELLAYLVGNLKNNFYKYGQMIVSKYPELKMEVFESIGDELEEKFDDVIEYL